MAAATIELLDAIATELLARPAQPANAAHETAAAEPARQASSGADFERRNRPQPSHDSFQAERRGSPSLSELTRDSLAPHSSPPSIASAASNATLAPPLPGIVRSPERTPAAEGQSTPAGMDAETLAALVNEALAEQARRHGVDLS